MSVYKSIMQGINEAVEIEKHRNKINELERIRTAFEQGENPTELMDEMERIFRIPALNDPKFNEQNPEIISLYREISDSRGL